VIFSSETSSDIKGSNRWEVTKFLPASVELGSLETVNLSCPPRSGEARKLTLPSQFEVI
jgi:hypothetical protein